MNAGDFLFRSVIIAAEPEATEKEKKGAASWYANPPSP